MVDKSSKYCIRQAATADLGAGVVKKGCFNGVVLIEK